MTGKELIGRIIEHDNPPRIGFDFNGNNPSDFLHVPAAILRRPGEIEIDKWGREPSLVKQAPDFSGELQMTVMGNIYGRLNGITKGECVKGALQDGWDLLETYVLPFIDEGKDKEFENAHWEKSDKFVLGGMPLAVWSPLRDIRRIDQALMDTLLEPEFVTAFLEKTAGLSAEIIKRAHKNGVRGIIIADDLGTQNELFFSPESFTALFKPYYKKLADELHNRGMKFFMHSCGKIYKIVPQLIDAGVDVFQFDQPELSGSDVWAREFGKKAVFYCPVDIQKIMPTGNEKIIKEGALNMAEQFRKCGGSLIAKDYPTWEDLNVLPEWQQWARDVIIANAGINYG
ncbi:MAG: hypothetical protein LBH16_01830 [Treponema sp.]|jgi:hypothetical protein|nr:hypothetical protein [Treponema sp.]